MYSYSALSNQPPDPLVSLTTFITKLSNWRLSPKLPGLNILGSAVAVNVGVGVKTKVGTGVAVGRGVRVAAADPFGWSGFAKIGIWLDWAGTG
ncbi:MAG: hypothetical protein QM730_15950 [Anaerolineales bacterium]